MKMEVWFIMVLQLILVVSLDAAETTVKRRLMQPIEPLPLNASTTVPPTSPATPITPTTTTTTTLKPTTTPATPTTPSTIPTTITTPTTTVTPSSSTQNTTSPLPPTTPPSTAAPTSKPEPDRKFDGPSFIGGMILTMGLMAIAFVSWKFYKARTERNYHTL